MALWLHFHFHVYHWSPRWAYSLNQLCSPLCLHLTHAYRERKHSFPKAILNMLTWWLQYTSTHTYAHTHTHTRMQIHTHRELGPCQGKVSKLSPQHGDISPGQEKVNEQEWFVCTRGSEHTMCFAVKLFCQLWRLRECTAHTNRLPRGSLPLIRHNHQQQMTERGGWRHRARSPLTEGDRKACWGWTGSPTYEGVGGKDAGNYLKFPRVWMQEIETEKTYAQMRSREAALHAYPERSHVMRLCITV